MLHAFDIFAAATAFLSARPYKMHVIPFAKGRQLIWIFPYNRTGAGLNGRKYRFIESLSVSVVYMAIFVELFRVFIVPLMFVE